MNSVVYMVIEMPDGSADRGDFPETVAFVSLTREAAEKDFVERFAAKERDESLESKTLEELETMAESDSDLATSLEEFDQFCFIIERDLEG